MSPPAAGLLVTMYKRKKPSITNHFPDLSVADLDQLPRGRAGYAQLKKLEERLLEARRELDARLEVINRAKPTFENWMDLELSATRAKNPAPWPKGSVPTIDNSPPHRPATRCFKRNLL